MFSRFCVTLALLISLTPAFAQTDGRALELLGAAEQFEPLDLDTLRMTIHMTNYRPDGEVEVDAKMHTVMDLEGRRLYQEMYFDGELALRSALNQSKMFTQSFGFGEEAVEVAPLPAEQAEQLGAMMETLQFDPASLYPVDYDTATYDGVQSYAGLARGEQVTVTMGVPEAMSSFTGETIKTRLIFGEDETLVATVQTLPETGTLLSVFGEYLELDNRFVMSGLTTYLLEGSRATLQYEMSFTHLAFNEPVDDRLFNLEVPVRRWLR